MANLLALFFSCLAFVNLSGFEAYAEPASGLDNAKKVAQAEGHEQIFRQIIDREYGKSNLKLGELIVISGVAERFLQMKGAAGPAPLPPPPRDTQEFRNRFPARDMGPAYVKYLQNPLELTHEVNEALSKYREKMQALEGPHAKSFSQLDGVKEALSILSVPRVNLPGTVDVIKRQLKETLGPIHQIRAQEEALEYRESSKKAIELIYRYAKADPMVRQYLFDPTIGLETGTKFDLSAEELLLNNRQLLDKKIAELELRWQKAETKEIKAQLSMLLELERINRRRLEDQSEALKKNGTVTLSKESEEAYFAKLQKTALESVERDLDGLNDTLTSFSNSLTEGQLKELRGAKREAYSSALSAITNGLSFLGEHRTAQAISTLGGGTLRLVDSFDKYKMLESAGAHFESTLLLSANAINLALTIFSLAASNGPTIEQAIYEQIIEVRNQIDHLGRAMHDRFDRLDRTLNEIYASVMRELKEIQRNQFDAAKRLEILQADVDRLQERINGIATANQALHEDAARREEWNNAVSCLNHRAHYNTELSDEKLEGCLTTLHRCAVVDSGSSLYAGALPTSNGSDNEVIARDVRRFPEKEIRFLAAIGKSYGIDLGESRDPFRPMPINPYRWGWCTRGYLQLAMDYPQKFSRLVRRNEKGEFVQLQEIALAGNEAIKGIRRVSRKASAVAEPAAGLETLFNQYLQALRELKSQADRKRNEYLVSNLSSGINLKGFDPYKGPMQPPPDPKLSPDLKIPFPATIGMCMPFLEHDHNDDMKGISLSTPPNLESRVPGIYKTAQHLRLGEIRWCAIEASAYFNPFTNNLSFHVTLMAVFANPDGSITAPIAFLKDRLDLGDIREVITPPLFNQIWKDAVSPRFSKEAASLQPPLGEITMVASNNPKIRAQDRIRNQALATPLADTKIIQAKVEKVLITTARDLNQLMEKELQSGNLKPAADKVTAALDRLLAFLKLGWRQSASGFGIVRAFTDGDLLPSPQELKQTYATQQAFFEKPDTRLSTDGKDLERRAEPDPIGILESSLRETPASSSSAVLDLYQYGKAMLDDVKFREALNLNPQKIEALKARADSVGTELKQDATSLKIQFTKEEEWLVKLMAFAQLLQNDLKVNQNPSEDHPVLKTTLNEIEIFTILQKASLN